MIQDRYLGKIIKEELKMSFGKEMSWIRNQIYWQKEEDGKMDGINSKKKEHSPLKEDLHFLQTILLIQVEKNQHLKSSNNMLEKFIKLTR